MIPNICYRPSSLKYANMILSTKKVKVYVIHPTRGKILLVCCRAPLVKLEPKVLLAPLGPGYVTDWKLRENLHIDCFL